LVIKAKLKDTKNAEIIFFKEDILKFALKTSQCPMIQVGSAFGEFNKETKPSMTKKCRTYAKNAKVQSKIPSL